MSKKQFKTESKRLLDLMINSVYTNKEIFLRELISNASDALDKLYFKTLTDNSDIKRGDLEIRIAADKTARTLTISDNGIGMTKEELESNLGTIAKSGTLAFKNDNELDKDDMDVIGQFGVGFYSAFMVSKKITVLSRAYGSDEAWQWESEGLDGYTVEPAQKDSYGTVITLYLKDNTDDERYDSYLETYTIRELVRKYSDYIRYPIRMLVETQREKTHECTCDHDAEGKCTCDHDHDDECTCEHDSEANAAAAMNMMNRSMKPLKKIKRSTAWFRFGAEIKASLPMRITTASIWINSMITKLRCSIFTQKRRVPSAIIRSCSYPHRHLTICTQRAISADCSFTATVL